MWTKDSDGRLPIHLACRYRPRLASKLLSMKDLEVEPATDDGSERQTTWLAQDSEGGLPIHHLLTKFWNLDAPHERIICLELILSRDLDHINSLAHQSTENMSASTIRSRLLAQSPAVCGLSPSLFVVHNATLVKLLLQREVDVHATVRQAGTDEGRDTPAPAYTQLLFPGGLLGMWEAQLSANIQEIMLEYEWKWMEMRNEGEQCWSFRLCCRPQKTSVIEQMLEAAVKRNFEPALLTKLLRFYCLPKTLHMVDLISKLWQSRFNTCYNRRDNYSEDDTSRLIRTICRLPWEWQLAPEVRKWLDL